MDSNAKILMTEMLQACRNVVAATAGRSLPEAFDSDKFLLENIYMNLYIIVENSISMGDSKKDFPQISWTEIGACADVLSQNVEQMDRRVIVSLIQTKLSVLTAKLEKILAAA
ncbi:MAG: hypothetical protein MJZ66_03750 [Bacteroidales bacterium]|nr:hypothetical protein [Bacteroidales bacterium]